MNIPGVKGGEQHRVHSPPARISDCTSPSQPFLTPSIFSRAKNGPLKGVGTGPQLDGGLLTLLPDTDSGGVEGYMCTSGVPHSVSKVSGRPLCWYRNAAFCCVGCGEAIMVIDECISYIGLEGR